MKKYILPVLFIGLLVVVPSFVNINAQYTPTDLPGGTSAAVNIWELLTKILTWFFNIVLFVAAIMIVYSGFQYITAGGVTEKTQKALNSLIFALVGVGIALLAKVLIYLVNNFLGTGVTLTL